MENKLKENEILIFADFNNTLVDYATEFDYRSELYCNFEGYLRILKRSISKSLMDFEKETGLTPVVCIITNASLDFVDGNGYNGICYDVMMTFFNHKGQSEEAIDYEINNSCEKYIKYVMHKENEGFLEINPKGKEVDDMFIPHLFSDKARQIKHKDVKRETVERFMHDYGDIQSKFVIFAGDNIQDDYPMKYAINQDGVNKIFIRPGKVRKMKPSIMQQFCLAKGIDFDCINPKNNKKIKIIDDLTLKFLTPEQQKQLFKYDDGDTVILTNQNSRGFIEGINECAKIIKNSNLMSKENVNDTKIFD